MYTLSLFVALALSPPNQSVFDALAARPPLPLLAPDVRVGARPMPNADGVAEFQQQPFVKMPSEVKVEKGRWARIKIETNGKTIKWYVPPGLDSMREYDADPSVIRLVVVGYEDATYQLFAYTAIGDVPSDPAVCTIHVGKGPGPIPPPDPKPGPTPDPKPPDPIPVQGFRVLVVYETAKPGNTAKIVGAGAIREYLDQKTAKGADGKSAEWRVLDKDTNMANAAKHWQDAMGRPRQSIPWLVIMSNGQYAFEGPLPETVEATLALLKKHGG